MVGNEDPVHLVTVVIPTYCRPASLIECIRSIIAGRRQPSEIIVVGRDDDGPTKKALIQAQELCAGKSTVQVGWVNEPGHIPPIEKGLELATGEIVAYVDDDVTVTREWLGHLIAPFSEPRVGVVGGRVITPASQRPRLKGRPGCTSWYGRHWGNVASLEGESPLDVHGVMECNWAWRRELLTSLRFDTLLNFDDASMYGLDLCLQAKSGGFRVIYQPLAVVYHHAAPRAPELDRADRPRRTLSYTRNYTYIMLKHLACWQWPIFLFWWFLVGERGSRGLASMLADAVTGRLPRPSNFWITMFGKVQGILLLASKTSRNDG